MMVEANANARWRAWVTALLMLASAPTAFADGDQPPEPAGYWQGPMNGKVPATIAGGTVIRTDELANLVRRENPVLVDVVPAPRRPVSQSTPWLPVPHRNIPRSVWIPGIGSGVISFEMEDYLRDRLAELTGHDREKLIVFYCRPDCWASWNAAKRAIVEGYRHVRWYPDGIEAWQAAGLPVEAASAEGPGVQ